jgi:hypothetical protein
MMYQGLGTCALCGIFDAKRVSRNASQAPSHSYLQPTNFRIREQSHLKWVGNAINQEIFTRGR